jgi:pSer/pThr/pTyr-binding forkhead associated (FHA) protein
VNHVVLRDAATSRFHADVRRARTGAYVFRSLGTNGSTLNDTPAGRTPRALADGDTIRIGGSSLRFTTVPPSGTRVVTRKEVAPGPRAHQPTPIYRSDEPNTVPPPVAPHSAQRGKLIAITAAILVAVVVLVVLWTLRGAHH